MNIADRGRVRVSCRGVPMLDRALDVLEHLHAHPEGGSSSAIARSLGFPRNTVHRILNTLLAREYVRRDGATMCFTLSRKLAGMACDTARERGLMEHVLPVLRRLRDATGETSVVSILDHGEGLVLEQAQGTHPFRFVCEPGTRQSIHASASTKAILARLPQDECGAALPGVAFRRLTNRTIVTRRAFDRELDRVRRMGYAVDHGEALDGVHCVAAAVMDRLGRPVAALTVTGPAERMPPSAFTRIGGLVRVAADEVSRGLGYGLNGGEKRAMGGDHA